MKIIILAAGQGTRLRPLTDTMPKCMVSYKGTPIIDYIIKTAKECQLENITVIDGYKKEVLENHLSDQNIKFCTNPNYDKTNMVSTFFCAESEMNDDIIISYADIIYKKDVLKKIIDSKADFSVIIDKDWKKLWEIRMEDPLKDAETLKLDNDENIIELGKKPKSMSEINGQYIGLIKISKKILPEIKKFYHSLDKNAIYDGKNFENMYMTSFIQQIINNITPAKAVFINGGWLEIDSIEDLNAYENKNII